MTAAKKRRTGTSVPVAAMKPTPPPDTFEAVRRDYLTLAMRYHRREIDRHQTRRERVALEARVAALKGDAA